MYGLRFVTQLSRAQRTGTTEFTKSMSVSELPQRIQCIETVIKAPTAQTPGTEKMMIQTQFQMVVPVTHRKDLSQSMPACLK